MFYIQYICILKIVKFLIESNHIANAEEHLIIFLENCSFLVVSLFEVRGFC